ncbi:MAG: GntR family transcriptional regulator [Acutalibacteraceae bacterium]
MTVTNDAPLYQKIYDHFTELIRNGVLKPGDKLPTEQEIMEQYQVSRATASRAMSDLAKDRYITRLRKLGSVVAETVQDLDSPNPKTTEEIIPLVVPVNSTDTGDLINGIQQKADEYNYIIPLYNTNRDLATERHVLTDLLKKDIGGLICYPLESYRNIDLFIRFMVKQIPVIFLDRPLGGIDFPVVGSDNVAATYDLTSMLIKKGHRHIAFVGFSGSSYASSQRLKGYIKAQTDSMIQPNPDFVFYLKGHSSRHLMMAENDESNNQAMQNILKTIISMPVRPTALICEHDLLASLVEKQARELNIKIPDELSVTGFDNLVYCNYMEVPLTTIAQDFMQIGHRAVEQLVALKKGISVENRTNIKCTVIERNSVATLK